MNAQEALARIKEHRDIHFHNELNAIYITEALDMAIEALEKQVPKRVILGYDEQDSICCPNCKGELMSMYWYDHWKCNYCELCGQALDWSDEE